MKRLKYGVTGAANISAKHLEGCSSLADKVKLMVVCDVDEKKMTLAAERYEI